MKELEFIETIKKVLSKSSHIGDDCAYLKDLGIVITQDNLVENIHFSRENASPYEIAYKSIMVNLSDIFAAGADPKYLTVALSLPNVEKSFIEEFYKACEDLSKEYDFEIVGGDITGSDKIFISVTAIGLTAGRNISSRKNAKVEDYVITTGVHGSSAAGLWLLQNEFPIEGIDIGALVERHIKPTAQRALSEEIATVVDCDYAMMDTSDGLMDALYKIASSSDALISLDFDKIPYDKEIEKVAHFAKVDFKDWIFYGGEDFQIVACVNEDNLKKLNQNNYTVIGRVKNKEADYFVEVDFGVDVQKITNLEKSFNHFKEIK